MPDRAARTVSLSPLTLNDDAGFNKLNPIIFSNASENGIAEISP
jgi:hypothetical protein